MVLEGWSKQDKERFRVKLREADRKQAIEMKAFVRQYPLRKPYNELVVLVAIAVVCITILIKVIQSF